MLALSRTPEYQTWYAMRRRCYDQRCHNYRNYGGRGISVCNRWLDPTQGFYNFLEDMGPRPGKGYSIERMDVNGHYNPKNCKWIPLREQSKNKRNSRRITAGQVYYKLTVLEETNGAPKSDGVKRRVRVLCECGNTKVVVLEKLLTGKIKSCGRPSCNKFARKRIKHNYDVYQLIKLILN